MRWAHSGVLAFALAAAGCGDSAVVRGEPIDVRGVVKTADGKPVADVVVLLSPTFDAPQVTATTDKAGRFTGKTLPGRFYVSFQAGPKGPGTLRPVPPSYHTTSEAHSVTVPDGGDVTVSLEKQ